jgi:hypothetical protein
MIRLRPLTALYQWKKLISGMTVDRDEDQK